MRKLLTFALITQFITPSFATSVNGFILPKDVSKFEKSLGGTPGAIYLSPTEKNKALMPVNFWGEVKRAGLHYVPTDTKLIRGLSLAGGPAALADLEEVSLSRTINNQVQTFKIDLENGDAKEYDFSLKPGDTVFVAKDTFHEDRVYYTSLFGVIATILSAIILYRQVRDN